MAKKHSKLTRVYVHVDDISGQSSSLDNTLARVDAEKTVFTDEGRRHIMDLSEDMWDWEGIYDDIDTDGQAGIDRIIRDVWENESLVSLWPGGDVAGLYGYCGPTAPGGSLGYTSRIAEVVAARCDFKFQGEPAARMRSFGAKQEFDTGSTELTGIDDGVNSAGAVEWQVHVFAIDANTTYNVVFEHSNNNVSFVTKDSVSVSARISTRRSVAAATTRRYTRLSVQRTAGTGAATIHASYRRL